ncbi:plasmid pRiA4b ORF-3 family protein [candidate division KSB1 bacterium]|nr:plasmid pRiA4b ORF-3 family protein [candidate division KSB1 bacterium]
MPTSYHTIFSFSATEPTPLLKDFETFCHYVEHNAFTLGKASGFIPYKPLAELNEMMTHPQMGNTPRTPQEYYPLLHLFYHLALAGKLFQKAPHKNQTRLQVTPRLAAYRALTPAEKYFFLLETLWMDCSLAELSGRRDSFSITLSLHAFLEKICRLKPNEPWDRADQSLAYISFDIPPPALLSFSFFGWYQLERNEASRRHDSLKRFFPVARLVPTQLGLTLAKILLQHRPLEEWNLPNLRSAGFLPNMPETRAIAATSFLELFRPLCAKDELRNTLPREIPQTTRGNFIFKVSVAPKIWRVLALSSKHTLHDLHRMIQSAFKFDDDHLYAFYMDNKWYSENRFEDPRGSEGPFADEAELGELGLTAPQTFLYHFDFGDDWRFEVQLLEIKTDEKLLKQPRLLETHGKAPEQYPNAERDW